MQGDEKPSRGHGAVKGLGAASALVGGAEVAGLVVRVALIPARTALLEVSQYGQLALWTSILAVAGALVGWPVNGLMRFLPGAGTETGNVLRAWVRPQMLIGGVCVAAFMAAGAVTSSWVWPALGLVLASELVVTSLTSIARSYQQFRRVATASVVAATVGGVVGLLLIAPFGALGVLLGGVVALVPTVALVMPLVLAEVRRRQAASTAASPASSSTLLRFAFPLAVGNLAWVGAAYIDRFFLDLWVPLAELGLYAFAYTTVALPLHVLLTTLLGVSWNQAVAAEAGGGVGDGLAVIRNAGGLYLAAAVPVGLGLCVFSPQIVALLAPSGYSDSAQYVPPVVLGVFIYGVVPYFNQQAMLCGKPRVQMVTAVTAVGVNTALNLALIPRYGAMGAAVATALSYFVAFVVTFWLTRAAVRQRGYTMRAPAPLAALRTAVLSLAAYLPVSLLLGRTDFEGIVARVVPAAAAAVVVAAVLGISLLWWARVDNTETGGTVSHHGF